MRSWVRRRPWVWIWVAFAILLGAWAVLVAIAVKHQPERIPLEAPIESHEH